MGNSRGALAVHPGWTVFLALAPVVLIMVTLLGATLAYPL
jgi:hypothetical protein